MHTGSALILMTWFGGAWPSSTTTPVISPAVDESTCAPAGPLGVLAGAGWLDVLWLPPPQAKLDGVARRRDEGGDVAGQERLTLTEADDER